MESSQDIAIVSEVGTGSETVEPAIKLQPDIFLIQMSDINGIEATRRILHTSPQIAIIALTMFEDDDFVFSALRAGARGYQLKGTMKADLMRAFQAVASGEAIFGVAIARRLMTFFADVQQPKKHLQFIFSEPTERACEILNLIASHLSNGVIAQQLNISLKIVRNHVSNIFSKLQIVDHAQAILKHERLV